MNISVGKAIVVLFMGISALFAVSLFLGAYPISGADLLAALRLEPSQESMILLELRLPRALLALGVGFSLGLSGAAIQGFLRNPLAEPGILGISGAASFGAVLALHTGVAALGALALPLSAIATASVAVVLLLILTRHSRGVFSLIIGGVALSALSGAMVSLVLNLSGNPYATYEMLFWLMGSLENRSLQHVWLSLPFMLLGWGLLLRSGQSLDALTLGEDVTKSLGVRLERTRLQVILGTACCVGAATAVAGAIGFIGLVVPHLLRYAVGVRPQKLLLVSGLGGAVLLLGADCLVRVLLPMQDLKLGVVTALIGAPFLIHLLARAEQT